MTITAYILITVVGVIPAFVAYFSAKHFFDFTQKSPAQIVAVACSLGLVFGTMFLQGEILRLFNMSVQNGYLKILTPTQVFIAICIFFKKLLAVNKRRQRGNDLM